MGLADLASPLVAGNHGRSVANTIAGKEEPYNKTAIFWSAQGAQLRYVRIASPYLVAMQVRY